MSDGFWAVRATEAMATRHWETEAYLRQEWPGESPGWFHRVGAPARPRTARASPGAFVQWVLCILRGPGGRGGRPAHG